MCHQQKVEEVCSVSIKLSIAKKAKTDMSGDWNSEEQRRKGREVAEDVGLKVTPALVALSGRCQ